MGKSSSSSRKKKTSKHSSSKRKKIRKTKSKKLRRRDDLMSSSGDDSGSYESESLSSSSDDDYVKRRSRSRSRVRKDSKGSKKRVRKRSPSSDSSEDSLRVKRRKRSKRKDDHIGKRKSNRKKSRRSPSISSTSRSQSCSTRQGRSSGRKESDSERSRGRPVKRKKGKRNLDNDRSRISTSSRHRSRSLSSCSLYSDSAGHGIQEEPMAESNSRRLRSVITVVRAEGEDLGKDELKEEMVYDHDDYPQTRSSDSIDGWSKRESALESQLQKRHVENDDATSSKLRGLGDSSGQDAGYKYDVNVAEKGDASEENKSTIPAGVDSQKADDLESVLRQKALENLLKFRKVRTNVKTAAAKKEMGHSDMQCSLPKTAALIEAQSPKKDGASLSGKKVLKTMHMLERDTAAPQLNVDKLQNDHDSSKSSSSGMKDSSCPQDPAAIRWKEKVDLIAITDTSKPESTTLVQSEIAMKSRNSVEQAPVSQELPQAKFMVAESTRDKSVCDAAKTVIGSSTNNVEETENVSNLAAPGSPHINSSAGESRSNEVQEEAKEASQYEQKTMSVMRGGEMVQVSYKVYIPKKAPALSRRKLKRW